jgi:hypothetical protein
VKQHLLAFGMLVVICCGTLGLLVALIRWPTETLVTLVGALILAMAGLLYCGCYIQVGSWLDARKQRRGGKVGW